MSQKTVKKEKTKLEVTKNEFYSNYHSLNDADDNMFVEDCQFDQFLSLLEDSGEFENPAVACRGNGKFITKKWSLLGYSRAVDNILSDEEYESDEESNDDIKKDFTQEWRYSIINGFFDDSIEVNNASKLEIDQCLKQSVAFIEKCYKRDYINDASAPRELQDQIIQHMELGVLQKIDIYIISDKVINQDNLQDQVEISSGEFINVYYWDLKKWDALHRSRSKRLPIEIDFNKDSYSDISIDYVKKSINKNLSQYLAIFPAELIFKLYDRHGVRLLENNVRVFLSAKRKANLEMRKTIKGNKDILFFSFNNGLSVTAEKIEFEGERISKIQDFQVVNGGQTTATIHYCKKRDKRDDGSNISLDNVYVPVKITEIKKDGNNLNYKDLVSDISKAANTQSVIKSSDFYANDPLLVELERNVNRTPVVNAGKNSYYFFERMSGQYNVMKNAQGNPGTRAVKIWEKEHPSELKFNKIDIARWYNCIMEYPHVAAESAEKQFVGFMEQKNFDREEMSNGRMKNLVGFGMIFKRIRKLVGTKTGKLYPSLIGDSSVGMATTIYSAAMLNKLCEGRIDYWAFFNHKFGLCKSLMEKNRFDSDIDKILVAIIKESWKQLAAFGKTSVQEQTKKKDCWEFFKQNFKSDAIKLAISKVKDFKVSTDVNNKRVSLENESEDLKYFKQIDMLLANENKVLNDLKSQVLNNSELIAHKASVSNFLSRIEKRDSLLTVNRVNKLYDLYKDLIKDGILKEAKEEISYGIFSLTSLMFSNFKLSLKTLSEKILEPKYEQNLESNVLSHDMLKDLKDKLDREHGLSYNDLESLKKLLLDLKRQDII